MKILQYLFGTDKSIRNVYKRGILSLLILVVVLMSIIWVIHERQQFRNAEDEIRKEYLEMRKEFVKEQTNSVIRYIKSRNDKKEASLKRELKKDVERAQRIVSNLYKKEKDKHSKHQLKEVILEALRGLYEGDEYVFVVRMDGTELLYPTSPDYEGKDLSDLQDDRGNYVIQDEIKTVKEKGKGFVRGYWEKPEGKQGKQYLKMTFVKKVPHFNWYIGKGLYVEDYQEEIKNEILHWASRIRYGEHGHVFINTYDGHFLLKNGKVNKKSEKDSVELSKREHKVVEKEKQALQNSEGGFINYQWEKLNSDTLSDKISFVRSFDQWNWIVGCGVYLDEVDKHVETRRETLTRDIKRNMLMIIIIGALMIILSLFYIRGFSKNINKDYRIFKDFLVKASQKNVQLETSQLKYSEIREVGKETNKMVAARAQAMEKQKIEKLYLETLLESAPEGVVITDKKGFILRVNSRFLSIFKYEQDEVLNNHIDELITPSEYFTEASQYTSLVGKGKELSKETIRQTKYNEKIYVSILANPIRSDIGQEEFYVIYRDITDRKKAEKELKEAMEKAREADHLKTAFLSNMSHEIRTPLNAIIGFSELVSSQQLNQEEKTKYGNLIKQNSQILLNLINDIIDVSKIESGQLKINKQDTDLDSLMNNVYETLDSYRKQNNKEHIELKLNIEQNGHCVRTDKDRLFQILNNLITNALKFTREGFVEYGYGLKNGYIEFYVKDTGIGISKSDQEKIFQRFQQADVSSTRKYTGTGLGLSISQSLTQMLGGKMKVKSGKNEGSVFSFTIPDEPCTDLKEETEKTDKERGGSKKETTDQAPEEKDRILIVEDEDSNYLYIQAVLKPGKYNYVRATKAQKAVEIATKQQNISLILMDIQLPDYSGYEAMQEIKKIKPDLPIIALTAYAMGDEKEKSFQAGCDDYLSKPVDKSSLLEKINKYISPE